jgi:putative DNA primase/helicase
VPAPLHLMTCAEFNPAPVQWLWEPYLARGKLAVLNGAHAAGKSLLATELAARLSRGNPLPGSADRRPPATTLLLTAEPFDTVRPRLEALGADLSRVVFADRGNAIVAQLPADAVAIADAIERAGAELLIIDSLDRFLQPKDARSEPILRKLFEMLALVAHLTRCAILVVREPGTAGGTGAAYRGPGRAALMAAATTSLVVTRNSTAGHVLLATKFYLGHRPASLGFAVGREPSAPPLSWTGTVESSAEEAGAAFHGVAAEGARENVARFLRTTLVGGRRPVAEVKAEAAKAGISWRMVQRVKRSVGVVAARVAGAAFDWSWSIPGAEPHGTAAPVQAEVQEPECVSNEGSSATVSPSPPSTRWRRSVRSGRHGRRGHVLSQRRNSNHHYDAAPGRAVDICRREWSVRSGRSGEHTAAGRRDVRGPRLHSPQPTGDLAVDARRRLAADRHPHQERHPRAGEQHRDGQRKRLRPGFSSFPARSTIVLLREPGLGLMTPTPKSATDGRRWTGPIGPLEEDGPCGPQHFFRRGCANITAERHPDPTRPGCGSPKRRVAGPAGDPRVHDPPPTGQRRNGCRVRGCGE